MLARDLLLRAAAQADLPSHCTQIESSFQDLEGHFVADLGCGTVRCALLQRPVLAVVAMEV